MPLALSTSAASLHAEGLTRRDVPGVATLEVEPEVQSLGDSETIVISAMTIAV